MERSVDKGTAAICRSLPSFSLELQLFPVSSGADPFCFVFFITYMVIRREPGCGALVLVGGICSWVEPELVAGDRSLKTHTQILVHTRGSILSLRVCEGVVGPTFLSCLTLRVPLSIGCRGAVQGVGPIRGKDTGPSTVGVGKEYIPPGDHGGDGCRSSGRDAPLHQGLSCSGAW